MNLCNSSLFWGVGIFCMSVILAGSSLIALAVHRLQEWDVALFYCAFVTVEHDTCFSCSSHQADQVSVVFFLIFSIYCNVISYADHALETVEDLVHFSLEEILRDIPKTLPNGKPFQQYLPNGVLNVVRSCESSSRCIDQYPAFASSLLNTFAFANLGFSSSTVGVVCGHL